MSSLPLDLRVRGEMEILHGLEIVNTGALDSASYTKFSEMMEYFSRIGINIGDVINVTSGILQPNMGRLRKKPKELLDVVSSILSNSIFFYCEERNVNADLKQLAKYTSRAIAATFAYTFLENEPIGFREFLNKYLRDDQKV